MPKRYDNFVVTSVKVVIPAFVNHKTSQTKTIQTKNSLQPQNSIRLVEGRLDNGQIYCQVERDPVTTVNNIRFDLPKQSYFLLLASGSGIRPSTVDYHDIVRLSSQQALKLSEVSNVAGKSKLLLRLHGAFMVAAWIGTASIGKFFFIVMKFI